MAKVEREHFRELLRYLQLGAAGIIVDGVTEHSAMLFCIDVNPAAVHGIEVAALGSVAQMMTGPGGKDQVAGLIRQALGRFDMVALLCESWEVQSQAGDNSNVEAALAVARAGASLKSFHGRREVMTFNLYSRSEQYFINCPITRAPGCGTFERFGLPAEDDNGTHTGRFAVLSE